MGDTAVDGFVVCTFGTLITLTESIIEKLFQLFKELQHFQIIFKLSRKEVPDWLVPHIPQNVLMREWLPQNDLLWHRNARLFITHAGHNSYAEALYHGIPLLAFAPMVHQKVFASKIEAFGFGKEVSLFTMNYSEIASLA